MKALKPSHRENKRYLLLKGKDVNEKQIEEIILKFIGILGYAQACPKIVKKRKDSIILLINRKSLEQIKAAFVISTKDINIEKISGMINKL